MPGTVNCSLINAPQWESQPTVSLLPANNITIWYGLTANLLHLYSTCYALLNRMEQDTATRYYQETDRQRYVIQHGILKHLLGLYLSIPPVQLNFSFNQNNKPYLADGQQCFFNLSKSSGVFLIALSGTELGVDIERIKSDLNYRDIASQYFGRDELAYIDTAQNPTQAFYLLWTRKEALLKACGMGIDDNLPHVPALNGQHTLPEYYPAKPWLTQSFKLDNKLMASVTTTSPLPKLSLVKIEGDLFKNNLSS